METEENKEENTKDIFETTLTEITRNYVHQAPVELPNQEQLTVKLVPLVLIEKLIESKSDYEMYISILFTMIGIFFGAFLTIFSVDNESFFTFYLFAFVALLVIIIIFLSVRLFILRYRYLKVKKNIYNLFSKSV